MVACDINRFSESTFSRRITITRILGDFPGDSGVHDTYRALDFRNEHVGEFTYTKRQARLIVDYVNQKYQSIDKYPVLMEHKFNNGPRHFHLQIPYAVTMVRGSGYNKEVKLSK